MKAHLLYLRYVLLHKWFVFLACRKCGVSLWRALIHDWSKFLPVEWGPYVHSFYNSDGSKRDWKTRTPEEKVLFNLAWNHHQKFNKHHWQYWLLTNDSDEPKTKALQMPECYWREMVADWWGAGRAITGKWDAVTWYEKNRTQILIAPETRSAVEELLYKTVDSFELPAMTPVPKYES